MRSMTGFGAGHAHEGKTTVSVHIASVNHRGVQVQVRSDVRDLALDEMVKHEVRTTLLRGSITVQVSVRSDSVLAIDRAHVVAAWEQLSALGRELGAPLPTIDRVVALVTSEHEPAVSSHEPLVRKALAEALAAHQAEREREGSALGLAFRNQAAALRALLPGMRSSADLRAAAYRASLMARVSDLLQDSAGLTPEQIIREVTLYAERVDVTEELVRLAAHLDSLDALINSTDDQLGRKLEFLLQEIAREINTTGAKSNDTALTNQVLEAKSLVEQMKEQSANVC
jgi:uncharacterized protein (TIGR00255 family)